MQMDKSICGKFGQQKSKLRAIGNVVLRYLSFLRNLSWSVLLGFYYAVSPRQGSGRVKLPYVPPENILLQELCYLIHCQDSTLAGIVAAGPEVLCLTHFISL